MREREKSRCRHYIVAFYCWLVCHWTTGQKRFSFKSFEALKFTVGTYAPIAHDTTKFNARKTMEHFVILFTLCQFDIGFNGDEAFKPSTTSPIDRIPFGLSVLTRLVLHVSTFIHTKISCQHNNDNLHSNCFTQLKSIECAITLGS